MKNQVNEGTELATESSGSLRPAEADGVAGQPLIHQYGFACCGPFNARRVAAGEYVIESRYIKIRVEGAALAEWVARALTQYDKCLDTIEKHLDDCFGCEMDTYEYNEAESDNDTIPCVTCSQLEGLVLARHNAEVEAARRAAKPDTNTLASSGTTE